MLYAIYKSSSPYYSGQEDFLRCPFSSLCEIRKTQLWASFHTRAMICSILAEGHQMMPHAIYESSGPEDVGHEDF